MDEERIIRATREGPPNDPAYVPALAAPDVVAFSRAATRAGPARNRAGGWARVLATALVAVLVVVALVVLRGGTATNNPIPVATAPVATPIPASNPTPSPTTAPTPTPTPSATATAAATPTAAIEATGNVTAIALGDDSTCALTKAGAVKCWGANAVGQLGNGLKATSATPVGVIGMTAGVRKISMAGVNACALTAVGGVKCWGFNVGTNGSANSHVPVDVKGLATGIVDISVGVGHTCAITVGGKVKCWGGYCGCAEIGVLGDGTLASSATPVDVKVLTDVVALAVGTNHTCALNRDGSVFCWGDNGAGQLGDGTTEARTIPVPVIGLDAAVTAIAARGDRTCAIGAGKVVCWGADAIHDASGTSASTRPMAAAGLGSDVVGLALGPHNTCVVDASASATCWGPNEHGQLGDGSRAIRVTPVSVSALAGRAASIAVGDIHACAITTAGALTCWGGNADAQLGGGVPIGIGSAVPVVVEGL